MATANNLSTRQKAIKASFAKDVRRRKAETWLFAEGTFLLALGCIFAAGCILALWLKWPPRLFILNSALLTALAGLLGLLVVRVVLLAALVLLIHCFLLG